MVGLTHSAFLLFLTFGDHLAQVLIVHIQGAHWFLIRPIWLSTENRDEGLVIVLEFVFHVSFLLRKFIHRLGRELLSLCHLDG